MTAQAVAASHAGASTEPLSKRVFILEENLQKVATLLTKKMVDFADIEDDYMVAEEDMNAYEAESTATIESLKASLELKETQLASLKRDTEDIDGLIERKEAEAAALKAQLDTRTETMQGMEAEKVDREAKIKCLDATLSENQKDLDELVKLDKDLAAEGEEISQRIETGKKKIKVFSGQNKGMAGCPTLDDLK